MGNNQSTPKVSAQDRAILDMKIQRDKLRQYQKRITVITDREKAIAKECLARGDKAKALLALRRKKYQESLLEKTDSQLEQLEKLTSSVEFALVQKDVLYGLKQGTQVLQQIHKEMGGLEAVEQLMGESEEARAYQQEISDALAGQMSNQDEDEVEDELERMEREATAIDLPQVPAVCKTSLRTKACPMYHSPSLLDIPKESKGKRRKPKPGESLCMHESIKQTYHRAGAVKQGFKRDGS